MHLAILGATSQIAKDFIRTWSAQRAGSLSLFSRQPASVSAWLKAAGVHDAESLGYEDWALEQRFDALINFVGSGNPATTAALGASIIDVSNAYDEMALDYVRKHPRCRYIFLSSGAAYGGSFEEPASETTPATIAINNLGAADWYAAAKLYAECKHRACADLPIVDVRIFNYFSHTIDLESRFLICDIIRAIKTKSTLETTPVNITRDFIGPLEFYMAIQGILAHPPANDVVDLYSTAPIEKMALLDEMQQRFGLDFRVNEQCGTLNATGIKPHYFSTNRRAEKYGYCPEASSLDVICREFALIP